MTNLHSVAIAGLCDIMLSLLTTSEHVWKIFRICGLVFTGFLPIVPRLSAESPRWCVAHGHIQKAFQCLRSLHETDVAAAEELYRIYARIRIESQTSGHDGLQRRFVELLTVPEIRRTYLASTAVAISGCLSGPGFTFAMFSLSIFDIDEGIVDRNQLLLKLLMSTTIVNATMLSSFSMSTIVKRRRRRFCVGLFLLFLSFLVSWFRFLVPTIYYLIPSLVTVVLSFVTVVISAFGSGAVPSVYVAEIFPTYYHRGRLPECVRS